MAESAHRAEPYATRFLELREQLVRVLGARTVDLIIERAAIEIEGTYPEMKLLRLNDHEAIDVNPLEAAFEEKSDEQIRAGFDALSGVVMLILARLLGREVATRLVQSDDRGGYARGPG